jgi:hypothetical protein
LTVLGFLAMDADRPLFISEYGFQRVLTLKLPDE